MSMLVSPSLPNFTDAFEALEKKGIKFSDVEKALLDNGLEIRACGVVDSKGSSYKGLQYRMAIALIEEHEIKSGPQDYKTTNEIEKIINKKIESALKKVLSEKLDVKKGVKNSKEFKGIYDIFTENTIKYKDNKMAEKQFASL